MKGSCEKDSTFMKSWVSLSVALSMRRSDGGGGGDLGGGAPPTRRQKGWRRSPEEENVKERRRVGFQCGFGFGFERGCGGTYKRGVMV